MKDTPLYDLVIIGASAAGSAAAIYAARRGLNAIIISKDIGGEVARSGEVENWPGIIHTDGIALSQQFHKHVESYKVPIENGSEVMNITQTKNYHVVTTKDADEKEKIYHTKTIIVASGIHPRELNVPGEKEMRGKGVTYCTVCDGPFFKGKTTATVGAGNSALESALMMAGIAKKVYLITKYDNDAKKNGFPKGEDILIKKIKAMPNVEIIHNANTTQVLGNGVVSGLAYKDEKTGKAEQLEVQGVMVHIGMIPNSDFISCVEKNAQKEIVIDTLCKTTCPGIFAAGDVTNVPYKQIVIAAGQGVTAALSAIDYLNKWE